MTTFEMISKMVKLGYTVRFADSEFGEASIYVLDKGTCLASGPMSEGWLTDLYEYCMDAGSIKEWPVFAS